MTLTGVVILAATGLLIMYGISLYNSLVRLKHGVGKAWANIDVLLRQRHDELPKLVETCKRFMAFERSTLERVVQARSAVVGACEEKNMAALGRAETELRAGLGRLFAVAERYPELKSDASFQHLQQRITALEGNIADRREFYNEAVNLNNVRIEQFPDVLIARLFGFRATELLHFSEEKKADVDLRRLFD